MQRFSSLILLVTFLFIPMTAYADFNKTKIAVLDFQLQGKQFSSEDMGKIVAEWFITAMVREGRFDVVERRMLQKVLSEQKLAMSGVVDATSATQIGKLLGVKVIITGSVMNLRNITEINARIIDVESASIIAAESVKSRATADLQDLVVEMSHKIMKNFPLEGYVVNRSGESVTLDLGTRTGVKSGMKFIVFKEGQVIKHPKTGEVLDVERIQTGIISITSVMQKICKATITEETSPGSINYGQLVKSLIETKVEEPRLFVETSPANATIRILNITPSYNRGMILEPGPYHIEVSSPGYKTVKEWITIQPDKEKSISFHLVSTASRKNSTSTSQTMVVRPVKQTQTQGKQVTALTGKQTKFVRMLESSSIKENRNAAKLITRERMRDTVILNTVERLLLKGFMSNLGRNHTDAMAWYCKALGASGLSKYRNTLEKVASQAPQRKLRSYASKSLRYL